MTLSRDDISFEGNVARRLFWEKCASRQPQVLYSFIDTAGTHNFVCENCEESSRWADRMLAEWDKRWIVDSKSTIGNNPVNPLDPDFSFDSSTPDGKGR